MEETLKLEVGNQYQIFSKEFNGICNLIEIIDGTYTFEAITSKRIIKLKSISSEVPSIMESADNKTAYIDRAIRSYTEYDDRWVQPGSYWWNFEERRHQYERLHITYRRGELVFYMNLTLNDGKERYADIHSIGIRTWIPEKFYIHKSLEDNLWTVKFAPKGFPFPKIYLVESRNDIKDKAYEYCYQPKYGQNG